MQLLASEERHSLDLHDTKEPYPVSFGMGRRREAKYNITDEELRPYFSLPNVLEGLFGVRATALCLHLTSLMIVWQTWSFPLSFPLQHFSKCSCRDRDSVCVSARPAAGKAALRC